LDTKDKLSVYSFFTLLQWDKVGKELTVSFNPKLKPHLLQLQTYAMGNLRYVLQLRGEYSKRIYMLLAQFFVMKRVTYSVDDLREILAIPDSYRYNDLKRLISKAQKELKEKSPFTFEFKEDKHGGRSIIEIHFKIISNNKELEDFKEEILENWKDQRLFEVNGRLLHANRELGLYYFNNDNEREAVSDDKQAYMYWKTLLEKREKLAIFTPSLINFDV